jgi:hypothetical protein
MRGILYFRHPSYAKSRMSHPMRTEDAAIPLAPHIEALAHQLVDDYTGKHLGRRAGLDLAKRIAELARIHLSQMTHYGPDEIARIARFEGVDESIVSRVLNTAGARCVSVDDLRKSWARTPSARAIQAKPGALTADGIDLAEAAALVKRMLHAARDTMRNKGIDTTKSRFELNIVEYGEAWGVLHALALTGVGVVSRNIGDETLLLPDWLRSLENEVLDEEHFGSSNRCEWCLERYGKDAAGRRNQSSVQEAHHG